MKNKIMKFFNETFGTVRARYLNGECWFVGKDICDALGYANSRKALADHVFNDYKLVLNAKTIQQMASQSKSNDSLPLETTSPRGMV